MTQDITEKLRELIPNGYGYNSDFAHTMADAANEIERLRIEVTSWILCDEKMPDPYKECIVGREDIKWPITALWTGKKWCREVTKEEFHVTHWMPLPSPPSNAK